MPILMSTFLNWCLNPLSGADEVIGKWWQFVIAIHDGVDCPILCEIDGHKVKSVL